MQAVQTAIASFTTEGINRDTVHRLESKLIQFGHIKNIDSEWCSEARALSLPGGIAITRSAFKSLAIDHMEVSTGAMREGLLFELLDRAHHEDVRELSVQNLITRYQIDKAHARRVATTALALFDQLHPQMSDDDENNRQVLRWSALLHEIGMQVSHVAYRKHGAYLLENMDIPGFSLTEQQMVAFLVLNHRRSLRRFDELETDGSLQLLCVLLRLAVLLRRNRTNEALPQLAINRSDSRVTLSVPETWLSQHPLTQLDIEEELRLIETLPLSVKVKVVKEAESADT